MQRDPYSNTQARFERTDRSGRYSPLSVPEDPPWVLWFGGAVTGVVLAYVFVWFF